MIRTAQTENGTVAGLPADDARVTVYKGIPFAAPPVSEYRWKAPQPAENWEGVRNCFEYAPISMQDQPGISGDLYCREFHVDPDIPISEDSLYLNVWTGAKSTDDRLPVLVWVYGGAFQWGYTAEPEFNGERIARHGIVVVTIAYRLGVFGFLAHSDLVSEDPDHPTNFGLLDQQAALSWVKRNIASFGGDPDNITFAGQSAGGASVAYGLTNPVTAGMVSRATVLSGFIRDPFIFDELIRAKSLDKACENGKDFLENLGCKTISEARSLDAGRIRDAYFEYAKNHPRFVPCLDEKYVKADGYDLFIRGDNPDIPLMAGYTKDEFMSTLPTRADMTKEAVKADITEKCGIKRFNVIQNSVRNVANAHVRNGKSAPMYVYGFAPDIPGDDAPGCFHSCDLWFWFETLPKCSRPYTGDHYMLARKMCDYWCNFIKTGDPNGMGYDNRSLPVWNEISSEDDTANEMIFTLRLP